MVAVMLILLIGCVNLVNLLFARQASRQREFAVRTAIGAGRWRLIRQMCAETTLLGLAGGALGLLFSLWACDWIQTAVQAALNRVGISGFYLDLAPDWRVFAYAAAISLAAGAAIDLWPALHASRQDAISALKEGASGSVAGYRSVWSTISLPGTKSYFCCRQRYVASAAQELWNVALRHDLWHITVWLRSMMIFGSGLPNGDCHYARTLFRQACNDRPHPGKLAGSRD